MTYARKTLVSLNDTPYYHVVARCVRRAWLWGRDEYAGRDYSHRKAWVLERLSIQASIFAIDICAYAVMSNHYHLVLHVDRVRARQWSLDEVVERPPARLKRILVTGETLEKYIPYVSSLLDDAPVSLLSAVAEQLHEEANLSRETVWKNYRSLARQVKSRRPIWE